MGTTVVGVALFIGIPVLFGVLGFRGGRWRRLTAAAVLLWTLLAASYVVAGLTADDVDPLWIIGLGPILIAGTATAAAPLLGVAVRHSLHG